MKCPGTNRPGVNGYGANSPGDERSDGERPRGRTVLVVKSPGGERPGGERLLGRTVLMAEANARVCERFGPEGEQSRATSLGTNFAGANGPDPLQSRQKERFYSIVNEFQSVVKKKIQGTSLIFVLLHNVRDFLPFYRNGLV